MDRRNKDWSLAGELRFSTLSRDCKGAVRLAPSSFVAVQKLPDRSQIGDAILLGDLAQVARARLHSAPLREAVHRD